METKKLELAQAQKKHEEKSGLKICVENKIDSLRREYQANVDLISSLTHEKSHKEEQFSTLQSQNRTQKLEIAEKHCELTEVTLP